MKIDLFYIEGEHDTVPGIARALVATEADAKKEAEELLKAGAHVYRQDMSVEVPLAYSHLEVEAALCVWEHLCEITVVGDQPASPEWMKYREDVGSLELRHHSIDIGKWVLQVYDLLPEWYRASGAYDWEIVPAIVSCLTPGEAFRDPVMARRELLISQSAKEEYFRSCDWHLKAFYGITIEDAGVEKDEFLQVWFDINTDPAEQIRRYAEKYDLEKIR
ncbi:MULTISPECIES: hypothetical protein [unclassified Mesorhizobium]|uniref:hypothetical protein n=1 Tax=unclassified Mesorhizobium TaxID=325217 RepID=UPI001125DA9C|nr:MULTISPECIES: hypothetical protein [unclassified Mesorhizobium]TPJ51774.1 hypothetical protein FJ426_18895 [Mesorhizobium sp. B2-6-4]TPN42396.1 hypothetical protein FJ979_02310 [Mesorhizobium sp. B1-1-6]